MGAAYDEDGNVFAGMGVDLADYDNDGIPDLFVNALANQGAPASMPAKDSTPQP